MSQQTFGHTSEIKPLALRQIAGAHHQQLVMVGLDIFHDRVDHMAHLHLGDDRKTAFYELVPQGIDQRGGPFPDRSFKFRQLRLGEVSRGEVRDGTFHRCQDRDRSGFRENAGPKKSGGGA